MKKSELRQLIKEEIKRALLREKVYESPEDKKFRKKLYDETLAKRFVKEWIRNDGDSIGSGSRIAYNVAMDNMTPSVYEALSKFKPTHSVKLYSILEKGEKLPPLSSWTDDKEWAEDMARGSGKELLEDIFSPDEILVDVDLIPGAHFDLDISLYIVKSGNFKPPHY